MFFSNLKQRLPTSGPISRPLNGLGGNDGNLYIIFIISENLTENETFYLKLYELNVKFLFCDWDYISLVH